MKTVGVIVTYNRKELLKMNIDMLLKQTRKLDNIIIIDNNSSDGTYDYLQNKNYLDDNFIIYKKLRYNTGGAGGFYHGTKIAYEKGYDFILLMDDDGRPYREDTLEKLFDSAISKYKHNKEMLINCLVTTDGEKLSFSLGISADSTYEERLIKDKLELGENLILSKANPFNGTLITKETIKKVGYPRKEFFISCDEVDYFHRCLESKVFIGTAIRSIYYHPESKNKYINFLRWRLSIYDNLDKEYYFLRNKTYSLIKKHKLRLLIIILLRIFVIAFYEDKKLKRFKQICTALLDAKSGRMGKRKTNE